MKDTLFVVESPGKIKTLTTFFADNFQVEASNGHVRDLPPRKIGVHPPLFEPEYLVLDRAKSKVAYLVKAAKSAKMVIIATDPDREGEGIAFDLHTLLKPKNYQRVTFSAINKKDVLEALAKPRKIDRLLVDAQKARRVLDRLFGYQVSNLVSAYIGLHGLSAGRVQSPALRLVVDRERAIRDFRSVTHYGVKFDFEQGWSAVWNVKNWLEDGAEYFLDREIAQKISGLKSFTVLSYKQKLEKKAPPAPFTTSKVQQAASVSLHLDPSETNKHLQDLYEKGAITYIRTDNPNFTPEASAEIIAFAKSAGLPAADSARNWKSKDGAQEAHEAIRPYHIEVEEAGETAKEKALYKLIRDRALGSQLADAEYMAVEALLEAELEGKKTVLEAKGRRLTKPGWRVLSGGGQPEEGEETAELNNPVPELEKGSQCRALSAQVLEKKTKPQTRFTKASLIDELERRAIGRPATFAQIVDRICDKRYVNVDKGKLSPTELGEKVIAFLVGRFSFLELDYTSRMEALLDDIANGKKDYLGVVREANEQLEKEIRAVSGMVQTVEGPPCPDCGRALVFRKGVSKDGRAYEFWGCSGWKEGCEAKFENDGDKPGEKKGAVLSEHKCPDCGKALVYRKGSKGGRDFEFWGCSGWKSGCKRTFKNEDGHPVFSDQK